MENIRKTYRKHMENIWKIHGINTFPMLFLRFPLGLALAFLWLHCGKPSLQVTLFDVSWGGFVALRYGGFKIISHRSQVGRAA